MSSMTSSAFALLKKSKLKFLLASSLLNQQKTLCKMGDCHEHVAEA